MSRLRKITEWLGGPSRALSLRTRLFLTIGLCCVVVAGTVAWVSRRAASEGFSFLVAGDRWHRETEESLSLNPPALEPLHRHEEAQWKFDQTLGISLFGILILAGLATVWLSRGIVDPLHHLTVATRRLRRGEPLPRLQVGGISEVAELELSFQQLVQQLASQEKRRRHLLSDVSHELRTPLTALRAQTEAMQDGLLAASPQTLSHLHDNLRQLENIVQDLQDVALADAGELRLNRMPLDLERETDALLASLEIRGATRARVRLAYGKVPRVDADPARLRQVLGNLIENAWHHTPPEGEITVTGRMVGDFVKVSVADTGSGIPSQDLTRIFERFYRRDRARDRLTGGAGLGLAVVRRLVEAHGGRVQATSVVGKGSTFSFTLPPWGGETPADVGVLTNPALPEDARPKTEWVDG